MAYRNFLRYPCNTTAFYNKQFRNSLIIIKLWHIQEKLHHIFIEYSCFMSISSNKLICYCFIFWFTYPILEIFIPITYLLFTTFFQVFSADTSECADVSRVDFLTISWRLFKRSFNSCFFDSIKFNLLMRNFWTTSSLERKSISISKWSIAERETLYEIYIHGVGKNWFRNCRMSKI